MGSIDLWGQIGDLGSRRVLFKQFIIDFLKRNGRYPKIAIDGYLWLFECGYFTINASRPHVLLKWLTKLKEMLHLQCSIVIVFDGTLKPSFKRQAYKNKGMMWNSYWSMKGLAQFSYGKTVEQYIIRSCELLGIAVVNAPGEGEAQCAWFQAQGDVDFVLTNDSDVLLFGATKVLKNYSKHGWDDLPNPAQSPKKSTFNERFVTVVDLDQVPEWDRYRLLLFSMLTGNDYCKGVRYFGGKRAAALARSSYLNISGRIAEILSNISEKDKIIAQEQWDLLGEDIFKIACEQSKQIFGQELRTLRHLKTFIGWPDVSVALLYIIPVIVHQKLPKLSTTWAPTNVIVDFLQTIGIEKLVGELGEWWFNFSHYSMLLRYINHFPDDDSFKLTKSRTNKICEGKYEIREVCVRYKRFLPSIDDEIKVSKPPACFGREKWVLSDSSPSTPTVSSFEYPKYIWLPEELIPGNLIKKLQNEISKKGYQRLFSPRRNISPQKNNLDAFLSLHTSPIKRNLSSVLVDERDRNEKKTKLNELDDDDIPLIVTSEYIPEKSDIKKRTLDMYFSSSRSNR